MRLTKYVGIALCLGMLCSSAFCYNSTVFAAESVGGKTATEVSVNDSNDYFETSEDGVTVKKDGYYALVFKTFDDDGNIRYISIDQDGGNALGSQVFASTIEGSIVYFKYSTGDTLNMYTRCDEGEEYYLCYSEDGTTLSDVVCVVPDVIEYMPVEDRTKYTPVVSNPVIEESDSSAKFKATLSVYEGTVSYVRVLAVGGDYDVDLETLCFDSSKVNFEYDFVENNTYEIWCYSDGGDVTTYSFKVDCIKSGVTINDSITDSKAPVITVTSGSDTGLTVGIDVYPITVKADETCSISINTFSKKDTTEFTGYVYYNGVYEVKATDSWGNTTTEEVTVTAFGDGSMPSADGITKISSLSNDNPLNESNRNTYWNEAQFASSSSSSSSSSSVLPQTGSPLWYVLVIGGSAVAITGGAVILKKSGVLKRKRGFDK